MAIQRCRGIARKKGAQYDDRHQTMKPNPISIFCNDCSGTSLAGNLVSRWGAHGGKTLMTLGDKRGIGRRLLGAVTAPFAFLRCWLFRRFAFVGTITGTVHNAFVQTA